jgi:hypothetical protein
VQHSGLTSVYMHNAVNETRACSSRRARTVLGRSETSVRHDQCRACGKAGEERAARSLKWTCGVQSARQEENRLAARWM